MPQDKQSLWDQVKSNWKSAQGQGLVPKSLPKQAQGAKPTQRVERAPARAAMRKSASAKRGGK